MKQGAIRFGRGLLILIPIFIAAVLPGRAATIMWTNLVGGNWNLPVNWSPNIVPGPGDTAAITTSAGYTVTLNVSPTISGLIVGSSTVGPIQTLAINGQTLTVNGPIQVTAQGLLNINGGVLAGTNSLTGLLTWSGGHLTGNMTITTNSALDIVSGGGDGLSGFVLTNYGTVDWTNTEIYGLNNLNAQIYNYGLWNAQSDNGFHGGYNGGTTLFDNFGTFLKSGNTGNTTLDAGMIFNNTGTVTVASGGLLVQGSGTNNGGSFTTTNGSAVSFTAYTFGPSTTLNGAGAVLVGSTVFAGIVTGTLSWAGGSLSGAMTLATNSTFNIVAGGGDGLNGFVLTNNGTVNWTNTQIYGLNTANAQIYNYGQWNALSDNQFYGGYNGGTTLFDNFGVFTKTGNTGATILDGNVVFNNTGTVTSASGTLEFLGGGANGGVGGFGTTGSGTFVIDNYSFGNGTTFTGNGLVQLGGNTTMTGAVAIPNADLFSGELGGTNVFAGIMEWSGGSLSGTMTVASGSQMNIVSGGGDGFNGLLLTNLGTVTWTNTTLYGLNNTNAQIYNMGLWNAQSDNVWNGGYNGGTTVFYNSGTFLKSGGSGTITLNTSVVFNNTGHILVQQGTLSINGGGTTSTHDGTFNISSGCVLEFDNYSFSGNTSATGGGQLILGGSATAFNGAITAPDLIWVSGNLSGVLTLNPAAVFNIVSGGGDGLDGLVLSNYGTVNWTNTEIYGLNTANAQIYNYGLWNAQSDNGFHGGYNGGTTLFDNFGVFLKSGNTGATIVDANVVFNNTGTITVAQGTLAILGGGTDSGSGTANTAGNAVLELGGINFANNTTITNTGLIELTGNTTITGTFSAPNVQLIGGTLGGTNVFVGSLTWSGGNLTGNMTLASNSTFKIISGGGDGFNGFVLTNLGTVTWSNTTLYGLNSLNAQIYNYGLWNSESDNVWSGGFNGGTTLFDNFGTFLKSGSGGATTLNGNVIFNNMGTAIVTNGTLLVQGGGTANNGSFATSNGGIIDFYSYTFTNATTITGTGSYVAGTANFGGSVSGTLTWSGGNLSGVLTMTSNSVFNIISGGGDSFSGLILTNLGTVNWTNTTIYGINNANAQIYNYGLWNAQTDNSWQGGYNGGTTLFDNFGTFLKSGNTGTTTLDANIVFNNTGTITANTGTLAILGGGTDSGAGTANTSSAAILELGGINFANGATITNTGLVELTGNTTITGTFTAPNAQLIGGTLGGTNTFTGNLTWSGGNLAGNMTLAANSVLSIISGGGDGFSGFVLTNLGTVTWSNTTIYGINAGNAQIYNYGLWNAETDSGWSGGYNGGTTLFDNFGTFLKSGSTSATTLDGNIVFNNTGILSAQSGTVQLNGTHNLSGGTLNFGLSSATSFGQIGLAGGAALTGTISANLKNGFIPSVGNSFQVLNFGSSSGLFTATNLPSVAVWTNIYNPGNVTIAVLKLAAVPPSPTLYISAQPPNALLYWTTNSAGYTLEQTPSLLHPITWTPVTNPVTVVGTNNTVTVSATNGPRYYELIAP